MGSKQLDEAEIFNTARKIEAPQARADYVERVCGDDRALWDRITALLRAHDEDQSFLESPPTALAANTEGPPIREGPGTVIGPYKLHEQIGEGGFGVVYLAEQLKPVRRRVALKIIKPGMDSKQVIARFEAERQALALMDHPNIARVLDVGATESGRPYFVMELVKGIAIIEYCDQCNLTTRERLELFISVCQAIQHAHQKGIIHRDVKPTNVMIAMQDGRAAPKVIDFGVAKAINQRLTEHTLYTRFAQMVGTPMYMSPEQAEMSPIEVDTRSDIYSLGVLLYELLIGATPFDKKRLSEASYDELRRIICEEQPPPPSSRLSTLGDMAATIAEHRRTDLRKLNQLVRGDLDWIVMKALEKDRTRRYETADGLARDIERYLTEEPVEARPPSAVYKFACRNRAALATTAVVLATVVVGLTVSTILIAREQGRTVAALTEAQENLQAAQQQRARAETNFQKAREAVDKMLTQVADELRDLPGLREQPDSPEFEEIKQALLEDALEFYQGFLQESATDPLVRYETGHAYLRVAQITQTMRQYQRSEETYRGAVELLGELSAEFPDEPTYYSDLASAYQGLAGVLKDTSRPAEAERAYRRALDVLEELVAKFPDVVEYRNELTDALGGLGWALHALGRHQESEQSFRRVLDLRQKLASELPDQAWCRVGVAWSYNDLGIVLARTTRFEEAANFHRAASEVFAKLVSEHPTKPWYRANFASTTSSLASTL